MQLEHVSGDSSLYQVSSALAKDHDEVGPPPASCSQNLWQCFDDSIAAAVDYTKVILKATEQPLAMLDNSLTAAANGAHVLYKAAEKPILMAVNEVQSVGYIVGKGWEWLGIKVEEWSRDQLSPDLANLTVRLFQGLPFTALYIAPAPIFNITFMGLVGARWLGYPASNETYRNFYNGWATGASINVIQNTVKFGMTFQPVYAICATISLIAASCLYNTASTYN
jgi:hypothetical protein